MSLRFSWPSRLVLRDWSFFILFLVSTFISSEISVDSNWFGVDGFLQSPFRNSRAFPLGVVPVDLACLKSLSDSIPASNSAFKSALILMRVRDRDRDRDRETERDRDRDRERERQREIKKKKKKETKEKEKERQREKRERERKK